jgi:hypothetical protein
MGDFRIEVIKKLVEIDKHTDIIKEEMVLIGKIYLDILVLLKNDLDSKP